MKNITGQEYRVTGSLNQIIWVTRGKTSLGNGINSGLHLLWWFCQKLLHIRQSDCVALVRLCDKLITITVRPQHLSVKCSFTFKKWSNLKLEIPHHTNAWKRKMQQNNDYYQLLCKCQQFSHSFKAISYYQN